MEIEPMCDEIIKGNCHCGAVSFSYVGRPEWLVVCNCSICRRLRPLLAHGTSDNIAIHAAEGATLSYVQGDKSLAYHSCKNCGCTTHWASIRDESPRNMAVNMALADPLDIADIPVRHFDGADRWQFLDV